MLQWLFVGQSHLADYTGGRNDFDLYDVRTTQKNRCCLSSTFYSTSIFSWHCILLAQLFKPGLSCQEQHHNPPDTLSSPRADAEGPHNRRPPLRERGLLAITSCVVSTGQLWSDSERRAFVCESCLMYYLSAHRFWNPQGKQIRLMRFNGTDNMRESFMFYLCFTNEQLAYEMQKRWVTKEDLGFKSSTFDQHSKLHRGYTLLILSLVL